MAEGFKKLSAYSSLISSLLGLEGISKRKPLRARRRTAQVKDPDLCGRQAGGGGGFGGRHSEYLTISIRARTGQSFCLWGVAQTAARLSAKLRARLSPGPVFR